MSFETEELLIEMDCILKILDSYIQHNDTSHDIGCLLFLSDSLAKKAEEISNSLNVKH